jgi:hypothetical protein
MPAETKRKAPRAADALEVFRVRAEARAHLYAAGELDLIAAVDVLQDAAIATGLRDQIGQDGAQAIIAAAFASSLDEVNLAAQRLDAAAATYDDNPDDDHAGLTHSFARLSTALHVEHNSSSSSPGAAVFHTAASTLTAAEYLIKQNDPARIRAWLAHRSIREVEAIWQHIKQKGGT